MPTPHNSAPEGAFAKTCLMPGDPLRAQFIAKTFLEDARLVNNVRGIQGYTGRYRGTPVSVMASGMGMPSIGIYSHELFTFYGVRQIIRIGSAGALAPDLKLRDIVAAQAACTNSNFPKQFGLPGTYAPIADFALLELAAAAAREKRLSLRVGNVLSEDTFYDASHSTLKWGSMGVLCAEMETAALYCNAAYDHARALSLLTISDRIAADEHLPPQDRETSFTEMMDLALTVAVAAETLSPPER